MLIPARIQYKDGGTVEYRAFLYSVKHWHPACTREWLVETYGSESDILKYFHEVEKKNMSDGSTVTEGYIERVDFNLLPYFIEPKGLYE